MLDFFIILESVVHIHIVNVFIIIMISGIGSKLFHKKSVTNKMLKQAGFKVNGRCYTLEYSPGANNYQCNRLCMRRDARLVSFNTLQEVRDVMGLVWRRQPYIVKVGLLTPTVDLPGTLWVYWGVENNYRCMHALLLIIIIVIIIITRIIKKIIIV